MPAPPDENGARAYLQLKEYVPEGGPIHGSNLASVRVPKILAPSFSLAVADDPAGRAVVIGQKARRNLYAGEFLWYPEFVHIPPEKIIPGQEVVTIMIAEQPKGQLLQPGGYVNIHGEFDFSNDAGKHDWRPLPVMENVQVLALGGSTEPVMPSVRAYDNIQIMLLRSQFAELTKITDAAKDHRFILNVLPKPPDKAAPPEISKEVRDFMAARQKPAATETVPSE